MKTFLRWAGGKQKIVNQILANIPTESQIKKYFEPFLGAGSLFFANGFSKAYLSDINPQLINTYKQIKTNHIRIIQLLETYKLKFRQDPKYYYQLRDLYNQDKVENNHIQAARFIFLIHTNYNGMYRLNEKNEYNVPLGKLEPNLPDLNKLSIISDKLKETKIECQDYWNILDKVKSGDFVYLDPPYPPIDWEITQRQYTVKKFGKSDHEKLSTFANELRNTSCYVLISYPDMNFIRRLYKNWHIVKLDAFRSISCKKERKQITELLIKNY